MNQTKIERVARLLNQLSEMGFSCSEAQSLRRIEMTLHRWAEAECNGDIQRNEKIGKPLRYVEGRYLAANDPRQFHAIADREAGALRRLDRIMAAHPDYVAYHQGDPRGCAVYIVRKTDVRPGEDINALYNRGLAICV